MPLRCWWWAAAHALVGISNRPTYFRGLSTGRLLLGKVCRPGGMLVVPVAVSKMKGSLQPRQADLAVKREPAQSASLLIPLQCTLLLQSCSYTLAASWCSHRFKQATQCSTVFPSLCLCVCAPPHPLSSLFTMCDRRHRANHEQSAVQC